MNQKEVRVNTSILPISNLILGIYCKLSENLFAYTESAANRNDKYSKKLSSFHEVLIDVYLFPLVVVVVIIIIVIIV